MGFDDPFTGYSLLLRLILYVGIPAFTIWQFFRLKRALHVFQLEGYKRGRFLDWCRAHRGRALFLRATSQKKALVMTGRAWRILVTALVVNVLAILLPSAVAHLAGGAPYDLIAWAGMTIVLFYGVAQLLVVADWLMTPVQATINAGYERAARRKLHAERRDVIAIAGSFGKTSTKSAVAALLGPRAFATPGSYNTPMGVTRAINEGLGDHRYVVIEMGAYRQGDIAELCATFAPTIGVLTSIGPAHLERFGSLEVIRRAKYEVIESLPAHGTAVMNVDDAVVRELADETTHVKVIRYGIDPTGRPDVTATGHSYGPSGTSLTIASDDTEIEVTTRLLGEHAVLHVLAGIAVARVFEVPLEELARRAAALEPVEHRLQLIRGAGGVTIIDDAFNSNPAGAAAAIEVLADLDETDSRRKIVVTPGIVELGELQREENVRFGRHAATIADVLVVVGRVNRDALIEGAEAAAARKAEIVVVDTLAAATEQLARLQLGPGDWVLFENDLPDQYEG